MPEGGTRTRSIQSPTRVRAWLADQRLELLAADRRAAVERRPQPCARRRPSPAGSAARASRAASLPAGPRARRTPAASSPRARRGGSCAASAWPGPPSRRSSARVSSSRVKPSSRDHSPMYIDGAYWAWMPPIRSSALGSGIRPRSSSSWRASSARLSSRCVRVRMRGAHGVSRRRSAGRSSRSLSASELDASATRRLGLVDGGSSRVASIASGSSRPSAMPMLAGCKTVLAAGHRERAPDRCVETRAERQRGGLVDRLADDDELVASEWGDACRPGGRHGAGARRARPAPRRPAAWPKRSFTCLNSSRSMKRTPAAVSSRAKRASACSSRSRSSVRLASPVSGSWSARSAPARRSAAVPARCRGWWRRHVRSSSPRR